MTHAAAAAVIPPDADAPFLASLIAVAAGRHAELTGASSTRTVLTNISAALTPMTAPGRPAVPPAAILREVSARYGVAVAELQGGSRARAAALARQDAMWELRERTALSLPQIGALLGGRDHTTVLHGVRAHARRQAAGEGA